MAKSRRKSLFHRKSGRAIKKNVLHHSGGGRQVTLYGNLRDPYCGEMINLLNQAGVRLRVHDIKQNPLNSGQIAGLIRNHDVERFLNPSSAPYKKNKLGKSLPDRQEVIELLAGDNDLFRTPIVVSGNMMSIGFDPRQIAGMLQIDAGGLGSGNGDEPEAVESGPVLAHQA
jgi:arsenate reductase-like glutaredoxin family protein